jgi:DeoR family transcriptional regulator, fructose operon transcriptional repressor
VSGVVASERRRGELRRLLQREGFVPLGDLADRLAVSESTVRRDVDTLVDQGEARRTHGGVFWTGSPAHMRLFEAARQDRWEEKRKIAEAASALIQDGETILLDGGSTTYELARRLVGRPIQVVTNSLPVATLLASSQAPDLIFVGGYIHGRTGVSIGPYADRFLQGLHVRRTVLSVAGIDQRGYYNSHLLLVETEKAMLEVADEVMIVADSSKFGTTSLARLCGLNQVGTVVTDTGLPESWQAQLRDAGVQLVLA